MQKALFSFEAMLSQLTDVLEDDIRKFRAENAEPGEDPEAIDTALRGGVRRLGTVLSRGTVPSRRPPP